MIYRENEVVAINDQGTELLVKKDQRWEKLVNIKSVPASGSEGGTIDVTEMNSKSKQYIPDRQDNPAQNFTYNRTAEKFKAVKTVCDGKEHEFLVKFQDGEGTYIKGTAQTWKNEVSVGSAQEATLHIVPTEIEDKDKSEVTSLIGG